MSARALWIVGLGAALAALIAFNVFRSHERGSSDAELPRPSSANEPEGPDDGRAAQRAAEEIRGSQSPDQRADAVGADGRDASAERPAAIPPNPLPHGSISQALKAVDKEFMISEGLLETERAFAAERVDPAWSTAAEAGVLGRIAGIPGVAYVSLNVECRTTLCLLQFVESATPAPNSGIVEVVNLVKPDGLKGLWMIAVRDRTGVPVAMAYLQRGETAAAPASVP
jgi:hypothetical protein